MGIVTCWSWLQELAAHTWASIRTWPATAAGEHNRPSPANPAEKTTCNQHKQPESCTQRACTLWSRARSLPINKTALPLSLNGFDAPIVCSLLSLFSERCTQQRITKRNRDVNCCAHCLVALSQHGKHLYSWQALSAQGVLEQTDRSNCLLRGKHLNSARAIRIINRNELLSQRTETQTFLWLFRLKREWAR